MEDFSDSPEFALATARRASEAMALHGVVPHPRNYALWYAYCAGSLPPLNRAIDAAITKGEPFTEARCASLHARFVAEPELAEASESVRQSVLRAMEYVGSAHRAASDYGRTIEAVSDRLEAADSEEVALVLTEAAAETRRFVDVNRSIARGLAATEREIAQLREHLEALRRSGRADPVTGLAARRVFDIALKEHVVLAAHDRQPLAVMMMDVDDFAHFRAAYGQVMADQVLRLIGRTILENVKGQDTVCRHGDQSFAAILPDTPLAQAEATAESIRAAIAARSIVNRRTGATLGQVTLSLGIAALRNGEAHAELMRRAAEALHAAKVGGANRAVCAE